MHDFNIHPLAATQLSVPTLQPLVERYGPYLFIALHFPIFDPEKQTSISQEIDFVLTPHTLLTTRYREIEPIETILKKCSFVPNKNTAEYLGRGTVFLFYHIVSELLRFSEREIDHIHKKIDGIEEGIFEGNERQMVPRISLVRRDIINFRGALKPQRMVLEALTEIEDFVDEYTEPHLLALLRQFDRTLSLIEAKREVLEELHSTNESLLNARTNEIMKTLTIMAFVTFPLMLFSSLFGMNTSVLPIVGLPNDFWIIIGIMMAATLGFFAFFKSRRWL
jgi:magnesium transporter